MTGAGEREARLHKRGMALPPVPAPLAAYVPAVRVGDLVFVSGQLPMVDGALPVTGKVGAQVDPAQAADLAALAALNAIAAAAAAAGGLDEIARVVKVVGYVACTPEFTGHPEVVNGASELIGDVFGDAGAHARAAVGVASLPRDAPVEIELVVQVR